MIIDCFIFHDELDMLEFRLAELEDAVDYHVLVEASQTIAGYEKELYFDTYRDRYSRYASKIVHIAVDDMPGIEPKCRACHTGQRYQSQCWEQEYHQRRCIGRGLEALKLSHEDVVIVGDCDEIPDPETIANYRDTGIADGMFALDQDFYYYNLTCKHLTQWDFARIFKYGQYLAMGRDCQAIRYYKQVQPVAAGGWHFSYFGGVEAILRKLESFSHQDLNRPENRDKQEIQQCIDQCEDFLRRPTEHFVKTPVETNPYLPKHYEMLL